MHIASIKAIYADFLTLFLTHKDSSATSKFSNTVALLCRFLADRYTVEQACVICVSKMIKNVEILFIVTVVLQLRAFIYILYCVHACITDALPALRQYLHLEYNY